MSSKIYLIGPMGVGKTTIGRQLANRLGLRFIDSDQEIEQRTGAKISLIFDIEGEEGFREREEKMIQELVARDNVVLATGGGAVLRENNRRALRSNGIVVYLRASIDTQLNRTRVSKGRPLLRGKTADRRGTLEKLLAERGPIYEQEADITVDTDKQSAGQVANRILSLLDRKANYEKAHG